MIKVDGKKALLAMARNFGELSPAKVQGAAANAINRALMKGRTVARSAVKESYNIPQKNLAGIFNRNANRNNLTGYIMASTNPIQADAFNPKFETPTGSISVSRKGAQKVRSFKKARKNAATGVSIEVKKGQRQTIAFAFMIAGAKPRVFARGAYRSGGSFGFVQRHKRISKGSDTPLATMLSVSVHGAVINPAVEKRIEAVVVPEYEARLKHELERAVAKMRDQS